MEKLPELYCYIFRNIIKMNDKSRLLTNQQCFMAMKKVIYKAPRITLRFILDELIDEYKVLKRIDDDKVYIILNKNTIKQLRKLREHVFPISV
jgi:hypothetical protein